MSAREWKPGDVALVRCSDGEWRQAQFENLLSADAPAWRFPDGLVRSAATAASPLVVLDPGGDLDPFCKALVEAMHKAGDRASAANGVHPGTVATALRSLLAPPKPDEPQGLGAVIEDDKGKRWVRSHQRGKPWYRDHPEIHDEDWLNYDQIAVIRVLFEGVQP